MASTPKVFRKRIKKEQKAVRKHFSTDRAKSKLSKENIRKLKKSSMKAAKETEKQPLYAKRSVVKMGGIRFDENLREIRNIR